MLPVENAKSCAQSVATVHRNASVAVPDRRIPLPHVTEEGR